MMRCIYRFSLFVLVFLLILCSVVLSTNNAEAGIGPVEGCDITIIKEANPADNTPFVFNLSSGGQFTLNDPGNNSGEFFVGVEQSQGVTEMVPEGWELVDIECSGVGVVIEPIENGRDFTCLKAFDMAICTFRNEGPPTTIPTLSEWGLIAMAGFLGIIGLLAIRRRKAAV